MRIDKPSWKAVAAALVSGGVALALIAPTGAQVNSAPTPQPDTATTTEDNPRTVLVLANDTDAESNPLFVDSVTQPTNGSVVINEDITVVNGDTVTYTPDANFHGTDTFTYVVTDGALSAVATVTMTVTPVNDAPVAANDTVEVTKNQPKTINVLGNDSDVDGNTLNVIATSPASHGVVSITADSKVVYTPTADYVGPDSFTYVVSDGTLTASATVNVAVKASTTPPPSSRWEEFAAEVRAACTAHGDEARIHGLCKVFASERVPVWAKFSIGANILRKVEKLNNTTTPISNVETRVVELCNTGTTGTLLDRLCSVYLDPTTPEWLQDKVSRLIVKLTTEGTTRLSLGDDDDDHDRKRDKKERKQEARESREELKDDERKHGTQASVVISNSDDDDDDDERASKKDRARIAIEAAIKARHDRDHDDDDDDRKRGKRGGKHHGRR